MSEMATNNLLNNPFKRQFNLYIREGVGILREQNDQGIHDEIG
jgi:hypothetical protein